MRRLLIVLAAVAGCATAAPIMGPDGTQHFHVSCPGNVGRCYAKAAEVCPAGYVVADRDSHVTAIPVNGTVVLGHRSDMLIKCRVSPPVAVAPTR